MNLLAHVERSGWDQLGYAIADNLFWVGILLLIIAHMLTD